MNLVTSIQNQTYFVYDSAANTGTRVKNHIYSQIHKTQNDILNTCQKVSFKCRETIDKIETFLYRNKETLFFIGCCTTTAYFAPLFFFPVAIVTAALRIELARNLKNAANYYLKDEVNPYKLNHKYETCISHLDMIMGTIGAVDAIALGTVFFTNSWSIFLLPILGGVAAGNAAAKLGMNLSDFLAPDLETETIRN